MLDPDRHLWQMRWVRDLVLIAVIVLVGWMIYEVRSIATPVVVALGLAYIFNPLTTYLHERRRIPRWASAGGILLVAFIAVGGLLAWLMPKLIGQIIQLTSRSGDYLRVLEGSLEESLKIEMDLSDAPEQIRAYLASKVTGAGDSGSSIIEPAVGVAAKGISAAADVAGWTLSVISYAAVVIVIISVCFVSFSWKWADVIKWFDQFIPRTNREQTVRILGRMDRTVSGIIRGRMIQAAVMGVLLSFGWWLAGVPYWLLLGVLGGLLNLAPFAASLAWIAAVILALVSQQANLLDGQPPQAQAPPAKVATTQASQDSNQTKTTNPEDAQEPTDNEQEHEPFPWWALVMPTIVYSIVQLLDGWVVEPIVQGQAADLGPVTVLLAVMVGGTLAGGLGLLLAIPVTACVKILADEILFQKLRDTAESMAKG